MTLDLGARCVDGVVIVADKKITDLTTRLLVKYDEKMYGVLRNVIFAYEGAEDMFKVFLRYVVGDVVMLRDDREKFTSDNLLQKLSDVMTILRNIRDPRSKDFLLSIMVARQFPRGVMSDLNIVRSNGKCEFVSEWRAIGSGEIIAKKYIERKWNTNMKMLQFAELGYSVIKFIENENLDDTVGVDVGEPSIRYLSDDKDFDTSSNDEEYSRFEEVYDSYYKDFKCL